MMFPSPRRAAIAAPAGRGIDDGYRISQGPAGLPFHPGRAIQRSPMAKRKYFTPDDIPRHERILRPWPRHYILASDNHRRYWLVVGGCFIVAKLDEAGNVRWAHPAKRERVIADLVAAGASLDLLAGRLGVVEHVEPAGDAFGTWLVVEATLS